MNKIETSLVIQWYEALEERLREFLRFVPAVPENLQVRSHVLAGLITETCGVLDSLFRRVASAPRKRQLDINDYAKLYGSRLADDESLVLVSPLHRRRPFGTWRSSSNQSPPPWWSAHNKLKHDRIKNIRLATLDNAIDSMCALQQAIALLPQMADAVLRHDWIHAPGFNPEILLERMRKRDEDYPSLVVETALFAVAVPKSGFPQNLNSLPLGTYSCSQHLRNILETF